MMMYFLLTLSTFLAATAQAGIWPYHGSAGFNPATGDIIGEYGYGIAPTARPLPRLTLARANGAVTASLSAQPILAKGVDASSKVIIGPSEGPTLVQGPQQGSVTIVGPSEGPALVQGPQKGSVTIVGPSEGAATIVGPTAGAATIIGPSEGPATIIGPTAGPATIVGPSSGAATIVGPSGTGATIVGPQSAGVTIIGPSASSPIIAGSVTHPGAIIVDEAHAHAHAHAEAHADVLSGDCVSPALYNRVEFVEQPHETVYIKDYIPGTNRIRERPSIVHHHHDHPPLVIKEDNVYDKQVICGPALAGWNADAAAKAVVHAGLRYGPVHVTEVQGRPVVTVSGPPSAASAVSGPSQPAAVISGPSGSIYTGNGWPTKKYWYPAPSRC